MPDLVLEQALYGNPDAGGFRFLARSPGFLDEWLPLAEQLCTGFGERPGGVACPGCLFVKPFGRRHVAVVQAADLGADDAGRPGALGFRLIVLGHEAYLDLTGDPFVIADRFPAPWPVRGELPSLTWPEDQPPARRTVAQVQEALKQGDSATLLGTVQALIDSGRVVFERTSPANDLVRRLWLLLPTSTRSELWPATFAFGNALAFDVLAVPRADPQHYAEYVREEQAGDYPEGRYELNLQIAAESGDQRQLDALFARRSSAQSMRLALVLVVVMAVLALVSNAINPRPERTAPRSSSKALPPSAKQPVVGEPVLDDNYPPLNPETERDLARALSGLNDGLGGERLGGSARVDELMLAVHDRLRLGDIPRDAARSEVVQRFRNAGLLQHPEAQLRAWLWLYEIPGYNDRRTNVTELVEKLQKKLAP